MKVERLLREKYDELHEFLLGFGEESLPDERVDVDALWDKGEIVSVVMSQTIKHWGPFYVRQDYLGGMAGATLIRHALSSSNGTEAHVIAMNSQTEEACQRTGLEKVEGVLYVKE